MFGRIVIVLTSILLGPKLAVAQTADRFWGYTFAAPAFFFDSVAIPTSFEPFSLRPRTFDVHDYQKTVLHWGLGFEWKAVPHLGIAAELSAIHLYSGRPEGMFAANASYHFGASSGRSAPFATGGYAYGINSNHGFNLGGGVNYWIRPQVGLRFEVRGTALKNLTILNVPGRFEPYAWTVDARVGLNFGRR